jgi:hypothetical protein
MQTQTVERKYVTARFLATRWACSLAHVYRLGERGEIRIFRPSDGVIRFALEDVEAYERERSS